MKLLIIGGTIFLGRHLVEAAQARGHEVTIFNRGQHNPELFPEVEKLHGDRIVSLDALRGRRWDAVIDTCGYVPKAVRASAELLADAVEHYTFISSVSAYAEMPREGFDESAPVGTITLEQLEEAEAVVYGDRPNAKSYGDAYGPLKALCEQAAAAAMPGRTLNIRAGLIVGADDYMDRFPYWVLRVARGGEMLAPGPPERRVRVIDVRDLADWNVRMAENRLAGTFNATGAEDGLTFGMMLDECKAVSASDAGFIWTSEEFLEEQNVEPWSELPLWMPTEYSGVFEARNDKAIAAGLTFRPLADTISQVLQWSRARPANHEWRAGLKPEREQELLHAWRER
jgi:2'-hydroxyisoflavone reductase